MLNGKGLFIWHDDRLYLGDWSDNMMHGYGSYKWGDGRMFIGQYVDDRKSGEGIYLWADGRAYHGEWEGGKQHGEGFYIVPDNVKPKTLKIKKGTWQNGKRKEWKETITQEEMTVMSQKYQEIVQRKEEIAKDIQAIENTIKELVMQQLGDKNSYDSAGKIMDNDLTLGTKGGELDRPLEHLIKEALNYDSKVYK